MAPRLGAVSRRHAAAQRRQDCLTPHREGRAVDAFSSINVYNAEAYFQKNDLNAYTVNGITGTNSAEPLDDDSVRRLRRE